jgi:hypothetical protein
LFGTIQTVIREFHLSTANADDGQVYEPPTGILRVAVIGDEAHLDWEAQPEPGATPDEPERHSACSFRVSARSLLLALHAAWDDEHPDATDGLRTRSRTVSDRPVNSHQPWNPELDNQLQDTWLAATPPATDRILELADAMGRSDRAIRARLARLGCDPDVPGRMLSDLAAPSAAHGRW